MPISVADQFRLRGNKQNFDRDSFRTLSEMKSFNESFLPDIFIATCEETGKIYVYDRRNEDDITTGKWREAGGGSYTDKVGSGVTLGGWNEGDKANGMSLQEAFYKLLHPYTKPAVTIGLSPATVIYDCVSGSISTIKIIANVTKNSKDIVSVKFYFGTTLVRSVTTGVAAGGRVEATYNPATPITGTNGQTYDVKVVVSDGDSEVTAKTVITFIGNSYYGVMEGETISLTEANIKLLTKDLKNKLGASYKYAATFGHFVYAYPSSLGTIKSVKDISNNVNYTESVQTTKVTIDSIEYTVISLIDAAGFDEITVTFA